MHKINDNKYNKEFSNLAVQTETAPTAEPTSGVNKTASQGQVEQIVTASTAEPTVVAVNTVSHDRVPTVVVEKAIGQGQVDSIVTSEPQKELTVVNNKAVGLDQGHVNLVRYKTSMALNHLSNDVNPWETGYVGSDCDYYTEAFLSKNTYSLNSSEIRMMMRDYDCIPKYCMLSELSDYNNNRRPLIKPTPVGPGGRGIVLNVFIVLALAINLSCVIF